MVPPPPMVRPSEDDRHREGPAHFPPRVAVIHESLPAFPLPPPEGTPWGRRSRLGAEEYSDGLDRLAEAAHSLK